MAINPRSHTPVYVQLAQLLRDRIESGDLPAGSAVPSESRLSQEYGIGRDAVRMAISLLRAEGVVSTSRGLGSWVREDLPREQIKLLPGSKVSARMPSSRERHQMDLDEGVPVLIVEGPDGKVQMHAADRVVLHYPESD
ncbi:GntR family transcriptional regulator [Micromonospora sp. WMMD882]|uniref:GntR family transcriptional regulator n=1 Tax=Micromonospora sp. WMMD882 TaxID=3015151 RepID=UPI00248BC6B6|nr:GntR family transcriptional regulator [Micromonospora sp. WMMD882]WBB79303.1 GntR family transcriptional regulator [Micromonospora sp. WMMD882]